MVTMAHPDGAGRANRPQPVKQGTILGYIQRGAAKLTACAGLGTPAQLLAHGLLSIADTQHRHRQIKYRLRGARRIRHCHRIRPT
ncbi:MAG: Uncharacterised protein [SAR116 cluster bacterium]|nr:MAG: Uncharacterised protein [SAR116 cluster bacterium]